MTAISSIAQENEAIKLLNAAVYQEEILGDLNQAIQYYEELVSTYPDNRAIVAEALYRIGLVNEKLGTQKARSYYEQVVNNYSEQSEMAKLAHFRLSMLQKREMQLAVPAPNEISLSRIHTDPDFYGSSSAEGHYLTSVDWMNCNLYFLNTRDGRKQYITRKDSLLESGACADLSAWSFDGRKIAYGFSDGSAYQLHVYEVAEDRSRKLISAFPDRYIAPLEWSRDGSQLLIIRGNSTSLRLQLLSVADTSTRQLKGIDALDFNYQGIPTISPNMRYLLYNTKSDGRRRIHLYVLETGESTLLLDNHADNWGMAWEKDGDSFIFASDQSGSPALYRLALKGGSPLGEPEMVYENINHLFKPLNMAEDGTLIFQSTSNLESIKLAELQPETGKVGKQETLFGTRDRSFRNPVWSNDGKKIACMTSPSTLYIYNSENSKEDFIHLDFRAYSGGWHQWSTDDEAFMVEQFDIDGNNRAFINLSTGEVEYIRGKGYYMVFKGSGHLIYTSKDQKEILMENRSSGEVRPISKVENEDQYFFLRISPDQKKLAFFEGKPRTTYWKDLERLWVLEIESGTKKLLWECGDREYFGWGVVNWTADGEHLMVFFGSDKTAEKGEENDFHPYKIHIQSGDKVKLGKILEELSNFIQGDFHPMGNRFVYSTMEKATNVWRLENLK
jgi:Tol biopolymer transport system component